MNYKGRIEIGNNSKILLESISPELKKQISKRTEINIENLKDKFIISIQSKDINALRAGINNILRLVQAVEKTIKIK